MSNALAIAAVTSMLDFLITRGSDGAAVDKVTTLPPDKARKTGAAESQINVFLYRVAPNAALRNMDMTGRTFTGATRPPPLALNLYYLITAYGSDDDDVSAHELLGHTMQRLHDHSVIRSDDVTTAAASNTSSERAQIALNASDLGVQVERLRISPVPLELDDLSNLWSMFQTPYRLSAAYEVSVVLIESSRPVPSPQPVLAVGLQANLMATFPRIIEALLPNGQPFVHSGDHVVLRGESLSTDEGATELRLRHASGSSEHVLAAARSSSGELGIDIPDLCPAGVYTLTAEVPRGGRSVVSNAFTLALAPRILALRLDGMTLTVRCEPATVADQRVSLLLGDDEVSLADPHQFGPELHFDVAGLSGRRLVRLVVDGVDSEVINRQVVPPRFFDDDTHVVDLG